MPSPPSRSAPGATPSTSSPPSWLETTSRSRCGAVGATVRDGGPGGRGRLRATAEGAGQRAGAAARPPPLGAGPAAGSAGGAPIDVHHGPHYTMPERARVPRVVTVHDLTFFDHPEWHEQSKVIVFRRAIRVAARRADAIVCVSRRTAQRLEELCGPTGRVFVVPHGVDHERFGPEPPASGMSGGTDVVSDDEFLRRLGVRPPYVVFVGTLEPRKAVPDLVAAFDRVAADHAELSLVLAGRPGWGVEAVEQAIGRARYGDRIVRTGYVPDDAVPALLRRAAVAAYPSLEEGFGLPGPRSPGVWDAARHHHRHRHGGGGRGRRRPGDAGLGARAGRRSWRGPRRRRRAGSNDDASVWRWPPRTPGRRAPRTTCRPTGGRCPIEPSPPRVAHRVPDKVRRVRATGDRSERLRRLVAHRPPRRERGRRGGHRSRSGRHRRRGRARRR